MRILCALIACLLPSAALANAAFEQSVNVHLRAYEACAKAPGARASGARQACAGHLAAAREAMTRLGYTAGQAETHVSLTHDRVIAPRLRAHFERGDAAERPAGRPRPEPRPPARGAKPAPGEDALIAGQLAEWSLCLDKARGAVLAYDVAPDINIAGTTGAIIRACNGYEANARDLHIAAGRSEAEADAAVRAFADRARAAAAAEIERRIARLKTPRETGSVRAAAAR